MSIAWLPYWKHSFLLPNDRNKLILQTISRKKNKLRLVKRSPKLNFYQPDDHNLLELVFDGNNSTGIKADVELPEKIYDSQASQSS